LTRHVVASHLLSPSARYTQGLLCQFASHADAQEGVQYAAFQSLLRVIVAVAQQSHSIIATLNKLGKWFTDHLASLFVVSVLLE